MSADTITSLADLCEGDIGFGPLAGGWGKLGMWGELIVDGGFHVGDLEVGHVYIVTSGLLADGVTLPRVVEAMPDGAREVPIGHERWTNRYAYVRLPEDYPGQHLDAAAIARAMIGTPYSFASYAALAAWRFGVHTPRLEAWIGRRNDPDGIGHGYVSHKNGVRLAPWLPCEAICSVLVDQAWALAGKQVMPAGTPHQCVTPSGLGSHLLTGTPGATWGFPSP
jgi:hypothetical protein